MSIASITYLCMPLLLFLLGLIIIAYSVRNLIQRRKVPPPGSRFIGAEQEYQRLKKIFSNRSGTLTETQKSLLHDIMVQDEQGRWWTIGYETGQWYFNDGEKWIPSTPPTTEYPSSTSGPKGVSTSKSKIWLSGIGGLILLLLGVILLFANLGIFR